MFHTKKLLIITSLTLCLLSAAFQTTQALTFTEVVNLLQAPDLNLPTGVTNPKGNIGFILSNLFWGTADGTKNGKIKPQYLDYSGISAWTQSGTITYLTVSTGSVGIGTSNPGGYATAIRGIDDTATAGALWVSGLTAGTPGLMVRNDGNVGIGTATPGARLDIRGTNPLVTIGNTSVLGERLELKYDSTGNYGWIRSLTTSGGNGPLVIQPDGGNVGIGTTTPYRLLSLKSSVPVLRFEDTDAAGAVGEINVNNNFGSIIIDSDASNTTAGSFTSFQVDGTEKMRIDATGNVGIGTTTPGTYKLYVNGTGYLGAAAWVYSSDRRLKENITPLKYGIKEIMKLDTKKFDYIKGEKNNLGFIAQDVQSILPELVITQPTGILGLKTDMIIPVLVNAMKEQQRQIEKLTDEVRELKKR